MVTWQAMQDEHVLKLISEKTTSKIEYSNAKSVIIFGESDIAILTLPLASEVVIYPLV